MRRCRWVWSVVLAAAVACGSAAPREAATNDEGGADPVSSSTANAGQAAGPIDVAVESRGLGPLTVAVGGPAAAPATGSNPCVQHDLTLTDQGDSAVFVNDFRQGRFLGDSQGLLIGVGGCGYATNGPDEAVTPACTADYRPLQVRAHESHTLTVTIWKELPGMAPLQPGRFVLEQPLQYRQDRPFGDPRQTGTRGTIVVTYTVK